MLHRLVASSALVLALSGVTVLASGSGGNSGALPAMRPLVVELVQGLETQLGKTPAPQAQADALIVRLVGEYSVCSAKERAAIVKILDRCVDQRRSTSGKLQGNPALAQSAAKALGTMGPESVDELVGAVGDKGLRKDAELIRTLVLALGHTREKGAAKPLRDLLDHQDDALVAAAAEALGEYAGAELVLRKTLFEDALKALMQAKDMKTASAQQAGDPLAAHDGAAEQRFETIQAALCTTLARLSRADPRDADQWQHWWNKNKRLDWDDKSKLAAL